MTSVDVGIDSMRGAGPASGLPDTKRLQQQEE